MLIIACACLVFSNFYILCTPWLLPAFPAINATTGTSVPTPVCEGILHFTGAPLNVSASKCYRTFRRTYERYLPAYTYSTGAGSPVPLLCLSVSPGGLSRMQFTLLATNSESELESKQSCASFLFTSVAIIETSQPLHYAFGSYRFTCCIVHHPAP